MREMFGTFVIFAVNSGINGDPNTKLPRQDPYDGHTYATDVSFKYQLRRACEKFFKKKTLIAPGFNLANEFKSAYDLTGLKYDGTNETKNKAVANLLKTYPDVGAFGLVGNVTKTQLNNVQGAFNFSFSRSLEPSVIYEDTITRCGSTPEKDDEKNTMGSKAVIKQALHIGRFHFNSSLAEKNLMTDEQVEMWLQCMGLAYSYYGSAAHGWVTVPYVSAFEWDAPLSFELGDNSGSKEFMEHFDRIRLENRISIKKLVENPMRWSDYEVTVDKTDLHPNIHYREIKHS